MSMDFTEFKKTAFTHWWNNCNQYLKGLGRISMRANMGFVVPEPGTALSVIGFELNIPHTAAWADAFYNLTFDGAEVFEALRDAKVGIESVVLADDGMTIRFNEEATRVKIATVMKKKNPDCTPLEIDEAYEAIFPIRPVYELPFDEEHSAEQNSRHDSFLAGIGWPEDYITFDVMELLEADTPYVWTRKSKVHITQSLPDSFDKAVRIDKKFLVRVNKDMKMCVQFGVSTSKTGLEYALFRGDSDKFSYEQIFPMVPFRSGSS